MKKIFSIFAIGLGIWCFNSCTKDKVVDIPSECDEVVTYIGQIKEIVDKKCANAGCHDGNSGTQGNYTFYSGLKVATNNGTFESRVIDQYNIDGLGMPDPLDVVESDTLTSDEIKLIRCWRENDYLEQ